MRVVSIVDAMSASWSQSLAGSLIQFNTKALVGILLLIVSQDTLYSTELPQNLSLSNLPQNVLLAID